MTKGMVRKLRCAVYTRKSTEEGLSQEFNSLHAQREACEAYIASQRAEGWVLVRENYDDGGFSGGTLERPALKRLMADIEEGLIDVVVVYKIDRLSRSLMDFSKLVGAFDQHGVTFVSVNGRDRSREAERRAAEAAHEKRGRELDARLLDVERRLARAEGRREAIRDRALSDPTFREAARVALWARTPGAVSATYADGEPVLTAPPGLPDGMTEEDLNAAILARVGFEDGGDAG